MAQSQFSLSWDAYQSSICSGFSTLQQNGEFVDMTLAADGHFVKVHQVLMAIASPYIKELLASAPCQHPVIFLNNVNHKSLCSILEYIYTGEVVVPVDYLNNFLESARALHIRGLENVLTGDENKTTVAMAPDTLINSTAVTQKKVDLPPSAKKIIIKHEGVLQSPAKRLRENDETMEYTIENYGTDDRQYSDDDNDKSIIDHTVPTGGNNSQNKDALSTNLQYSVSNRGSLQVILNRYIYNLTSTSKKDNLRRWRCVDYRSSRCPAFVITKENVVVSRSNPHNHAFHDKRILSKIERKGVFSAIEEATKDKDYEVTVTEETGNTMDQDTSFIVTEIK